MSNYKQQKMKRKLKFYSLIVCLFMFCIATYGRNKITISGRVTDAKTGEELLGASVFIKEIGKGVTTNLYGYYSITIEQGKYTIIYNYIGYKSVSKILDVNSNMKLNVELNSDDEVLEEVVVTAEKKDRNIEAVEMSVAKIQVDHIKKLPAFMGEVDIMKTIQMLPGVQSGGEGSAGLYVRGGGTDQNLIQLDEAPVYNASHFLGFFSVFNSDAIKDMKVYKGGIPAEFGGRLSSLVDIRMKEGNSKDYVFTGGIGNLSSRITAEGPIVKDKASFIVSARRTYADLFLKASPNEDLNKNVIYFYDLNGKINYKISEKDRLFFSVYNGTDVFDYDSKFRIQWGNTTASLRWNHLYTDKLFSNTTFLFSQYNYLIGQDVVPSFGYDWVAKFQNYNMKVDYNYFLNPENSVKFGYNITYHYFEPGEVNPTSGSAFNKLTTPIINAIEAAVYASNEQKVGDKLTLQYGLRYSGFATIGKGKEFKYSDPDLPSDKNILKDTTHYKAGEVIKWYSGFEPRISAKFKINSVSSVKASYNRTMQYLHLLTNTNTPTPLDIWVPSNKYIKPQMADQVAAGYFRNFMNNSIELSVEGYYKHMDNQIDFVDQAQLLFNKHIETEVRAGKGYSYGAEFMLRKQTGKLTGWLSYTYSKTRRKIEHINNGEEYRPSYDREHDLSLVLNYKVSKKWDIGVNWVYTSGFAATYPEGKYMHEGKTVSVYGKRNSYRAPDYHRLDVSATYTPGAGRKTKWNGAWNFSLFNVYARKNAYSIYFRENKDNPTKTEAVKMSILGTVIPSVTYTFKF